MTKKHALLFLIPFILTKGAFSQERPICVETCCIVDLNRDITFQAAPPGTYTKQFGEQVAPSLFKIVMDHIRAYGEYLIPFDSVAKVTGLYALMNGQFLHACCDCCPNSQCVENVEFTRLRSSDTADFVIKLKNVSGNFYTVSSSQSGYKINLEIGKMLKGQAIISPDLIRLFFPEAHLKLSISTNNITVEEIEIRCITVTPNRIVYMPSGQRPFQGTAIPLIIYK